MTTQQHPVFNGLYLPVTPFSFANSQTHHFYTWVAECVDVPDLIEQAFCDLEDAGEEACLMVRDNIAVILEEVLFDNVPEMKNNSGGADGLWKRILADALAAIDFRGVAEVLLIQAGKWAPPKNEIQPSSKENRYA